MLLDAGFGDRERGEGVEQGYELTHVVLTALRLPCLLRRVHLLLLTCSQGKARGPLLLL